MSKSNRTEDALVKLVDEGRAVELTTEAGYQRFKALERQISDELRRISTADTDPELEHVEAETALRVKHNAVVKAIRQWEAKL